MAKNQQNISKKYISDAQLQNWLIAMFERGNTDKANLYELLRTDYKIMKQRFYKFANIAIQEWQTVRKKAVNEQIHTNAVEQLKTAVMSKQERLEYLTKIAKAEVTVKKPFIIRGEIVEYNSEPDASDRIRAIAEINKIEGDYAITKQEIEHKIIKVIVPDESE